MTTDTMPEFITVLDICKRLNVTVLEAQRFVKRNREALRPFKVGREIRCASRNFKELLDSLQAAN